MPFKAYLGAPFERTHESVGFDELYERLQAEWGQAEELVVLLGNFSAGGASIDVAFLKRSSFGVVDLKDYGGRITFAENGPWYADDVVVKGGTFANPFVQLKHNRRCFRDALRAMGPLPGLRNPNHGRAIVVFQQPIQFDASVLSSSDLARWFFVTDVENFARTVDQSASPEVALSVEELEAIPRKLGLKEYSPRGTGSSAETKAPSPTIGGALGQALVAPYRRILEFLASSDEKLLIVRGMIGTGKHELIEEVRRALAADERSYSLLSPNRRTADRHEGAASLYSAIYDSRPRVSKEQFLFELRSNDHPDDHIYVVTDAHLVSDSAWETELFRFGSGKLLSDLMEFVNAGNSRRKVLVFGDPYQLGRGRFEESALCSEELERLAGVTAGEVHLDRLISDAPGSITSNARAVANQIAGGVYNQFHVEFDGIDCVRLSDDEEGKISVVRDLFERSPADTKFLVFKNEQANNLNQWIRKNVFGRTGPLQQGDLIHFYGGCIASVKGDPLADPVIIPQESSAFVQAVTGEEIVEQALKGRDATVVLAFLRVEAMLVGHDQRVVEFLCFKDYLDQVKPDLDADVMLALRVHAIERFRRERVDLLRKRDALAKQKDSSEYLEVEREIEDAQASFLAKDPKVRAARVRFGYAMTVHRSQGRTWPTVIATMDTGQGQKSESFFRWAYTLFAITGQTLTLTSVPDIHQLIDAKWTEKEAKIGMPNLGPFIPFDPQSGPEQLQARVRQVLQSNRARLVANNSHSYQEQFVVAGTDRESCTFSMYYGGRGLTKVTTTTSEPETFAKTLLRQMITIDFDDEFQRQLFETVAGRLAPVGAEIIGVRRTAYKEIYLVQTTEGLVELGATYNKAGFVTALGPLSYECKPAVEVVRSALGVG